MPLTQVAKEADGVDRYPLGMASCLVMRRPSAHSLNGGATYISRVLQRYDGLHILPSGI